MTPPEAIDLAALRALAEKATPGPWMWDWGDGSLPELRMEDYDGTDPTVLAAYVCKTCHSDGRKCLAPNPDNADFIAAANPRTVLALLDRLAAACAVVEAAREWLRQENDPNDDGDRLGVAHDIVEGLRAFDRAIAGQQQQEGTT